MSKLRLIAIGLILLACPLLSQQIGRMIHDKVLAEDQQEVKPYAFAELPHGRIYKAVHQGCEIFVVENDFDTDYHNIAHQHQYAIAAGRGCH